MARQHPEEPTLVELSIEEVKAMGKQGMKHPSTPTVLTGGVVGAVAGAVNILTASFRKQKQFP